MPLFRLDREGPPQPNGAVPVYTDWNHGPSLAAVRNCVVYTGCDLELRRSARITAEHDTCFSQPAFITVHGKRVTGFVTGAADGFEFRPYLDQRHKLQPTPQLPARVRN